MSEVETAPPSTLLVAFVLAGAGEALTVRGLRHRVTEATGRQPADRTVRMALSSLVESGSVTIDGHDQDSSERRYRWTADTSQ